jgi:glycosyltransferase involved in cell wall biosynthesis
VSDGSTDDTDNIVKRYCAQHDWIKFLRMPERRERHFAAKVRAFDAGHAEVKGLNYEVIGNLDADISFEADHFSFLMQKFAENPRLGVAGTAFREGSEQYDYRYTSIEHVSGQCQMFRRQCFEEIGGYVPAEGGGIDLVAVIKARMAGWKTRTFSERIFIHHRQMGTAKYGPLMAKFKDGEKDYVLGGHPVWEIFRCIYQSGRRPFVVGGCALGAGFACALAQRRKRSIPSDVMEYRRREQMARLRALFRRN